MRRIFLLLAVFILLFSCIDEMEDITDDAQGLEKRFSIKPIDPFILELPCGTVDDLKQPMPLSPVEMEQLFNVSYGDAQPSIPQPPCNYRVRRRLDIKFHIVRKSDGTGGIPESELVTITNNINAAFNEILVTPNFTEFWHYIESTFYLPRIGFINSEVNYIDDTALYYTNSSEFSVVTNIDRDPNKMNIYLVKELTNSVGNQIGGRAYIGGNALVSSRYANTYLGSSPAHELGHNLALRHTHQSSTSLCLNQNNSHTTGDQIWDTPLDLKLSSVLVNSSCNYTGNQTTSCGESLPATNTASNLENIMSYSRHSCRKGFSLGQFYQMNEQITLSAMPFTIGYLDPCNTNPEM